MGQEVLPNVTVSFYIKPPMEELGVLTWSRPNLAQEELVMKTNLRKGGQVSTCLFVCLSGPQELPMWQPPVMGNPQAGFGIKPKNNLKPCSGRARDKEEPEERWTSYRESQEVQKKTLGLFFG